jgi:hypothetical protein
MLISGKDFVNGVSTRQQTGINKITEKDLRPLARWIVTGRRIMPFDINVYKNNYKRRENNG